ncbi:hypothetical protein KIH86_19900 [Paenibacillus sp. HN-1]|uniref:hypothetical protein n=1 Tax=Paenibacillus TaxID=44249 RepID=UPI001CA839BB|nr:MULTISPECIES: hypothetical protein [Paenibacillus]MBY9081341.1 hypothetical protein [Paenibacillus sp. CGMCC 1.18879]MBY9086474.1 hypothetical protein [Paenibacillus sinensis]
MYMQLTGQEVTHIVYGTGRIVKQEEGRIEVLFTSSSENKTFVYPDAFERYLSMNDPFSQQRVLTDIEQVKQEREERQRLEQQRAQEEAEKKKNESARKAPSKRRKK